MQLWQHRNGTYYILYGDRLKKRLSTRTRDRVQAERELAGFIIAQASPQPEHAPTVGEILAGYEKDRGPMLRGQETLKYNVINLTVHFGPLRPSQLLPATVRQYVAARGVKPGTILREIGALRAALGWAVEHQWIAAKPPISNPVKTPRPRDRWLTQDEARRLIAACHEPHMRAFVMLGLMTAARSAAILEAKWEQVDLERGVVDYGLGHGNKRRAVVPLNDELRNALTVLRSVSCTEHLIERHGRRVTHIKKGFRAACARAGLVGVSPHIMRHTAATWMAMADVPIAEIARVLGDEEKTVERVYAKHSPSYLRRATSALQLDPPASKSALQMKGGQPECGGNVPKSPHNLRT